MQPQARRKNIGWKHAGRIVKKTTYMVIVSKGEYFLFIQQHSVTFSGAFAKLLKATISFFMSVCPHGTTRLPLDGFL
jgi:hypothetical protein